MFFSGQQSQEKRGSTMLLRFSSEALIRNAHPWDWEVIVALSSKVLLCPCIFLFVCLFGLFFCLFVLFCFFCLLFCLFCFVFFVCFFGLFVCLYCVVSFFLFGVCVTVGVFWC